jgi:hypothetical protein
MKARGWWSRWPDWVGYATAAWTFAYGALGVLWATGGPGFPFGLEHDAGAKLSVFSRATPDVGGRVVAVLGIVGGLVALWMARARRSQPIGHVAESYAWLTVVLLCFVVPDFRVLAVVAYAPILLLGAPFDWPQPVRLVDVVPWAILNQALCIVGGLGWAATAIVYHRRVHDACEHCGRARGGSERAAPEWPIRWSTLAVVVAVVVPVFYALTRFAWALGFPFGLTDVFFREGQATGLWWRGAALGALAIGGAVLTVGLVRPWGEVFPRWVPFAAGKRVPHALVVVPATLVSVIVTAAGLMFIRMSIFGTFRLGTHAVTFTENWGALWPELVWPLWGAALGVATLGYHYRTRGGCVYCDGRK